MERKDYLEKYESVNAFIKTLNERITNYKGEIYDPSFKFCGTNSLEEANDLFYHGDKENADKVTAAKAKIKAQGKGYETRNSLYNSPCGFMPIVPKVLAGDPQNMLAIRKERYNSTKVLNIAYNVAVDCTRTTEDLIETAAKVANVIASLEKNGYRVNLYAYSCGRDLKYNYYSLLVKIKDSGKYLDTLRIAYPLVNPSFYRRHVFGYMERLKGFYLNRTYGKIVQEEGCKECLPINACYLSYYLCSGKTEEEIAKYIESAK